MSAEDKILLKKIGVGLAVVLFLATLTIIIYKLSTKPDENKTDESEEEQTDTGGANNYSNTKGYDNKGYSFAQVEKMQGWLFNIASLWKNALIVDAIRSTGSIDGKMGEGFNKALNEAIRVGYVKDLADLYKKSISN